MGEHKEFINESLYSGIKIYQRIEKGEHFSNSMYRNRMERFRLH